MSDKRHVWGPLLGGIIAASLAILIAHGLGSASTGSSLIALLVLGYPWNVLILLMLQELPALTQQSVFGTDWKGLFSLIGFCLLAGAFINGSILGLFIPASASRGPHVGPRALSDTLRRTVRGVSGKPAYLIAAVVGALAPHALTKFFWLLEVNVWYPIFRQLWDAHGVETAKLANRAAGVLDISISALAGFAVAVGVVRLCRGKAGWLWAIFTGGFLGSLAAPMLRYREYEVFTWSISRPFILAFLLATALGFWFASKRRSSGDSAEPPWCGRPARSPVGAVTESVESAAYALPYG